MNIENPEKWFCIAIIALTFIGLITMISGFILVWSGRHKTGIFLIQFGAVCGVILFSGGLICVGEYYWIIPTGIIVIFLLIFRKGVFCPSCHQKISSEVLWKITSFIGKRKRGSCKNCGSILACSQWTRRIMVINSFFMIVFFGSWFGGVKNGIFLSVISYGFIGSLVIGEIVRKLEIDDEVGKCELKTLNDKSKGQ